MERGILGSKKVITLAEKTALSHHRKPEKYRERQKIWSKMGSGLDI
jgi:hypothetical protein